MATRPGSRRGARAARLAVVWTGLLLLAAWFVAWSWHQPFVVVPRTLWELSRMTPAAALPVPVQGIAPAGIADTYGAPRSNGRTHQGVDIFARRGTPVLSVSRGIVVSIRESGLGGRQVWMMGPGRERHYYAHLENWHPGLAAGDVVAQGAQLGTVGNSGNARGTPPHLHYGIYGTSGAHDPLPLLQAYAR